MKARTTATIPLDIIESVIEVIATDEDTRSLEAVSQTCHTLLPLCRKHIFSTIRLSHKSDHSRHFNDLLSTNPDIARYVKHLEYGLNNPSDDHQQGLDVLQKHSDLRSVHLWSQERADWSAFPASIRSSLLSLIQLPTITHLRIRSFMNFPATALLNCHNLIDLQMELLEITSAEVKHISIRDKIPTPISLNAEGDSCSALEALLQTAGPEPGPIVDFSLLQSASFDVEIRGDILIVQEVIKTTTQLQSLFIFSECITTYIMIWKA
ncbi:hypothetical protein BDZ97DRAFT_1846540 [Flammula alnicola]|nr:hypothetical protein BDZ97DRAFT_1846540 [Flammula alnicola]